MVVEPEDQPNKRMIPAITASTTAATPRRRRKHARMIAMANQAGPDASALNRELTRLLADVGERMGFSAVTEFTVDGGRLDVVWTWDPVTPIPGLVGSLPVIGFEIESSWRTRKHVKGDLLNLQDAGVALGVIVLAGADARDESLRRFATSLVDRRGTRVLIWTEKDVRALAAGQSRPSAIETESVRAAARASASGGETVGGGVEHTGKYRALWSWLRAQDRAPITLTFTDLERRAGVVLPDSCRNHLPHWYGYQGSAVARAIIDAGWHASNVDLNAGSVMLVPGPPQGRR
jgi:hypothetical protein